MRPCSLAYLLIAALVLFVSAPALAAPSTVPYDGPLAQPQGPAAPSLKAVDCTAGNPGTAAFLIVDWSQIGDAYRYYFTGNDGCMGCPAGFQPETLGFTAQLEAPGTYTFELVFAEALPPSETECAVVGNPLCSSGEFEVFVNPGGLFDITAPVNCPCLLGGVEDYYIELRLVAFETTAPAEFWFNLALDDTYVPCTSFQVSGQDIGLDLADVLGETPPGSLLFWADSACCQNPVATEQESWGALKTRF